MVTQKPIGCELVTMLATSLVYNVKAVTYFDTFYRVNPHHSRGNIGIETIKNRLSPSGRQAVGNDL